MRGTHIAPDRRHLLPFSPNLKSQLVYLLHDSEAKNTLKHYAEYYLPILKTEVL